MFAGSKRVPRYANVRTNVSGNDNSLAFLVVKNLTIVCGALTTPLVYAFM